MRSVPEPAVAGLASPLHGCKAAVLLQALPLDGGKFKIQNTEYKIQNTKHAVGKNSLSKNASVSSFKSIHLEGNVTSEMVVIECIQDGPINL